MDPFRLFQKPPVTGIWHIDIRDDRLPTGRLKRTLRTRDLALAEERAAEVYRTVFAERAAVVGSKPLKSALTEVADSKANEDTRESAHTKARAVCRVLGDDYNLLELDMAAVERYIAHRREGGVVDHTIHKELSLLRQAWAAFCPGQANPVFKFSSNYKPRKRFLTLAEAAKFLRVAGSSKFAPWLWMALYAGCEVAALRRMGWQHIDFDMGYIHVLGTKGETRDRMVPLGDELREYLEGLDRNQPLLHRWPSQQRWRQMNSWCNAVKIDHACMLDLRRTFGSWLKQNGVDSKRIADLMGHTTTIMVDRVYAQLDAPSYKDAIAKLPRLPKVVGL